MEICSLGLIVQPRGGHVNAWGDIILSKKGFIAGNYKI